MDRIQWFLVKAVKPNGRVEVTVTDPDKVKNLFYDGTNVSAVGKPFSWNVSQVSPNSEYLL